MRFVPVHNIVNKLSSDGLIRPMNPCGVSKAKTDRENIIIIVSSISQNIEGRYLSIALLNIPLSVAVLSIERCFPVVIGSVIAAPPRMEKTSNGMLSRLSIRFYLKNTFLEKILIM